MATQSCLSARNNSRTFAGAFPLPRTLLSNSFQVCLSGFKSGDMEGQGRLLDVVVGEELCGVECCMGSGVVVLKYSAIQRFVAAEKYTFLFLNSIHLFRLYFCLSFSLLFIVFFRLICYKYLGNYLRIFDVNKCYDE